MDDPQNDTKDVKRYRPYSVCYLSITIFKGVVSYGYGPDRPLSHGGYPSALVARPPREWLHCKKNSFVSVEIKSVIP